MTINSDGVKVRLGGVSVNSEGLKVTDGVTISDKGISVTGVMTIDQLVSNTNAYGLTLLNEGFVTTGGLSVMSDGLTVTGGATIWDTGLFVMNGGLFNAAGGMAVTLGGLTTPTNSGHVAGGLTVEAKAHMNGNGSVVTDVTEDRRGVATGDTRRVTGGERE